MRIKIERAESGDIDALIELLAVLFSIEQDFKPNKTAQYSGLKLLMNQTESAQVFVARHAEEGVVGMVTIQLVISTAVGSPSGWIEDLVLHERFRGHGLGKLLLDEAISWAKTKGAKRVQLLADADNEPALNFYEHLGLQPTRLFAWKKLLE